MDAELIETLTEVDVTRRRFTVVELLRLAEIGILGDNERVELIHGELVEMSPINAVHASTVNRLNSIMFRSFGDRIVLSVQNPVQLNDETLLQPDITLLKPQGNFFRENHPGPEDVLLLIEVSDTTLQYDRRVKRRLYGAAGIVDYWIVDVPGRQIEVYREPWPDGYRTVTSYMAGDSLSPLSFPDIALKVDDLLGFDS